MLDSRQTLAIYENVLFITSQMLEAAQQRDWQQMAALEKRCSQQVEIIKIEGSAETLTGDLRDKKVQLIRDILDNDRAIRDITHPWLNELSALINTMGTQRKLEMAYSNNRY